MRRNIVRARAAAAGVAGVAVIAAIVAPSAAADADPSAAPTSDAPAPAPPGTTVLDMVAQARAINATDPTVLLGQRPDAANPDAPPLGPLNLNPLNNANLLPQNLIPSAPGEGTMVGVPRGQESENTTFRGLLSRLSDMFHAGDLAGAGLGQRPPSELTGPPPADTAQPVPPELASGG
jgi:hypothetical protein